MNDKPILFTGEMVRRILLTEKTQTRRVIKPQPQKFIAGDILGQPLWYLDSDVNMTVKCPYGRPGDRLWVRETFCYESIVNKRILYRADYDGRAPWDYSDMVGAWKPSIHMPRWASRLIISIVNVRVERLQDITEGDAIKEGVQRLDGGWKCYGNCKEHETGHDKRTSATASFMSLWDSINGKKYPWESNPFVWVIEFRRITP